MTSYLGGRSTETQLGMGLMQIQDLNIVLPGGLGKIQTSSGTLESTPKKTGIECRRTPERLIARWTVDLKTSSNSKINSARVPNIGKTYLSSEKVGHQY